MMLAKFAVTANLNFIALPLAFLMNTTGRSRDPERPASNFSSLPGALLRPNRRSYFKPTPLIENVVFESSL